MKIIFGEQFKTDLENPEQILELSNKAKLWKVYGQGSEKYPYEIANPVNVKPATTETQKTLEVECNLLSIWDKDTETLKLSFDFENSNEKEEIYEVLTTETSKNADVYSVLVVTYDRKYYSGEFDNTAFILGNFKKRDDGKFEITSIDLNLSKNLVSVKLPTLKSGLITASSENIEFLEKGNIDLGTSIFLADKLRLTEEKKRKTIVTKDSAIKYINRYACSENTESDILSRNFLTPDDGELVYQNYLHRVYNPDLFIVKLSGDVINLKSDITVTERPTINPNPVPDDEDTTSTTTTTSTEPPSPGGDEEVDKNSTARPENSTSDPNDNPWQGEGGGDLKEDDDKDDEEISTTTTTTTTSSAPKRGTGDQVIEDSTSSSTTDLPSSTYAPSPNSYILTRSVAVELAAEVPVEPDPDNTKEPILDDDTTTPEPEEPTTTPDSETIIEYNSYSLSIEGGRIDISGIIGYTEFNIKNLVTSSIVNVGYESLTNIPNVTITTSKILKSDGTTYYDEIVWDLDNKSVDGKTIYYKKSNTGDVRYNNLEIKIDTIGKDGKIVTCKKVLKLIQAENFNKPWQFDVIEYTNPSMAPYYLETEKLDNGNGLILENIPVIVVKSSSERQEVGFYLTGISNNVSEYISQFGLKIEYSFLPGYETETVLSAKESFEQFFTIEKENNTNYNIISKSDLDIFGDLNPRIDRWYPFDNPKSLIDDDQKQLIILVTITLDLSGRGEQYKEVLNGKSSYSTSFIVVKEPTEKRKLKLIDTKLKEISNNIELKEDGSVLKSDKYHLVIDSSEEDKIFTSYWIAVNNNSEDQLNILNTDDTNRSIISGGEMSFVEDKNYFESENFTIESSNLNKYYFYPIQFNYIDGNIFNRENKDFDSIINELNLDSWKTRILCPSVSFGIGKESKVKLFSPGIEKSLLEFNINNTSDYETKIEKLIGNIGPIPIRVETTVPLVVTADVKSKVDISLVDVNREKLDKVIIDNSNSYINLWVSELPENWSAASLVDLTFKPDIDEEDQEKSFKVELYYETSDGRELGYFYEDESLVEDGKVYYDNNNTKFVNSSGTLKYLINSKGENLEIVDTSGFSNSISLMASTPEEPGDENTTTPGPEEPTITGNSPQNPADENIDYGVYINNFNTGIITSKKTADGYLDYSGTEIEVNIDTYEPEGGIKLKKYPLNNPSGIITVNDSLNLYVFREGMAPTFYDKCGNPTNTIDVNLVDLDSTDTTEAKVYVMSEYPMISEKPKITEENSGVAFLKIEKKSMLEQESGENGEKGTKGENPKRIYPQSSDYKEQVRSIFFKNKNFDIVSDVIDSNYGGGSYEDPYNYYWKNKLLPYEIQITGIKAPPTPPGGSVNLNKKDEIAELIYKYRINKFSKNPSINSNNSLIDFREIDNIDQIYGELHIKVYNMNSARGSSILDTKTGDKYYFSDFFGKVIKLSPISRKGETRIIGISKPNNWVVKFSLIQDQGDVLSDSIQYINNPYEPEDSKGEYNKTLNTSYLTIAPEFPSNDSLNQLLTESAGKLLDIEDFINNKLSIITNDNIFYRFDLTISISTNYERTTSPSPTDEEVGATSYTREVLIPRETIDTCAIVRYSDQEYVILEEGTKIKIEVDWDTTEYYISCGNVKSVDLSNYNQGNSIKFNSIKDNSDDLVYDPQKLNIEIRDITEIINTDSEENYNIVARFDENKTASDIVRSVQFYVNSYTEDHLENLVLDKPILSSPITFNLVQKPRDISVIVNDVEVKEDEVITALGFHSSGYFISPTGFANFKVDFGINFGMFLDESMQLNLSLGGEKLSNLVNYTDEGYTVLLNLSPNYTDEIKKGFLELSTLDGTRTWKIGYIQGYITAALSYRNSDTHRYTIKEINPGNWLGEIGTENNPIVSFENNSNYLDYYTVNFLQKEIIPGSLEFGEEIIISSGNNELSSISKKSSDLGNFAIVTYQSDSWENNNPDIDKYLMEGYDTDLYFISDRSDNSYPRLVNNYTVRDNYERDEFVFNIDVKLCVNRYKKYLYEDIENDNLISNVIDINNTPFKFKFWIKKDTNLPITLDKNSLSFGFSESEQTVGISSIISDEFSTIKINDLSVLPQNKWITTEIMSIDESGLISQLNIKVDKNTSPSIRTGYVKIASNNTTTWDGVRTIEVKQKPFPINWTASYQEGYLNYSKWISEVKIGSAKETTYKLFFSKTSEWNRDTDRLVSSQSSECYVRTEEVRNNGLETTITIYENKNNTQKSDNSVSLTFKVVRTLEGKETILDTKTIIFIQPPVYKIDITTEPSLPINIAFEGEEGTYIMPVEKYFERNKSIEVILKNPSYGKYILDYCLIQPEGRDEVKYPYSPIITDGKYFPAISYNSSIKYVYKESDSTDAPSSEPPIEGGEEGDEPVEDV